MPSLASVLDPPALLEALTEEKLDSSFWKVAGGRESLVPSA